MARWRRRSPQNHSGIVYILRIVLEGTVTYKIGITTKTVVFRAKQIIEGVYKTYGYFPEVRVLRQGKTKNHFKVETAMHNQLCDFKYIPDFTFTGSTELFRGIEEAELIDRYELALNSDEPAEVDDRIHVW